MPNIFILLLVTAKEVANLMLAIGACLAIIGIINIYNHIQMGKPNVEEKIWTWVGGILLLILIPSVIMTILRV